MKPNLRSNNNMLTGFSKIGLTALTVLIAAGFPVRQACAGPKIKVNPIIFEDMRKPNQTSTSLRSGDAYAPRFYYGNGNEQQLVDKNIMLRASDLALKVINEKETLAAMFLRTEAVFPARPSVVAKAMKSKNLLHDLLISDDDKPEDWKIEKKTMTNEELAKLRTSQENTVGHSFSKAINLLGKTLACDFNVGSLSYEEFQKAYPDEDTVFQRANNNYINLMGKPEAVVITHVVNFHGIEGVRGFEMMSFVFRSQNDQGSLVVNYQVGGFDRSKLALKKILFITVASLDGQLKANVIQPYPASLTREADRLEIIEKRKNGAGN